MRKTEREFSRIRDAPILTAYGCALLERETGKSFIYTAINLETGESEVLSRRTTPLTTSGVEAIVEKLRHSRVAGTGVLGVDKPFGKENGLGKCLEVLNTFFYEILPDYGYSIRKEQIALSEHILETINNRSITLAEAEVGTGKTLAYLAAAVLAKRGRLNGHWNMSFYTGTPYIDMAHMPIVIATSSIALQKVLITDYIPVLSDILMENEIIKTPLTAALRKGREHYICRRNLSAHISFENNPEIRAILTGLLKPYAQIDIAEIDGLDNHVKRIICVPNRCFKDCSHIETCPYLRFRKEAESIENDIQVCNHNYLLADTIRRTVCEKPLIPNYQCIIIDEAHKFLDAARTMYGTELSNQITPVIKDSVYALKLKHEDEKKHANKAAKTLSDKNKRLFRGLRNSAESDETEDDADRLTINIDEDAQRHLRSIRNVSDELIKILASEPAIGSGTSKKSQIIRELETFRDGCGTFLRHDNLITWLETGDNGNRLCAIPKDIDNRLFSDLWNTGIPNILTSGTLSADGDFSHIKRTLGLNRIGNRLRSTRKSSPFNYRKNGLLYISENVPFPDRRDENYINALANEVEELILASYGHAAVLFTSYNTMGRIFAMLDNRDIPFPMFRLGKGDIREIERFKRSGNGVLFASGAMWEGIDVPGDALSTVILTKLPFNAPDLISEYERKQYSSMNEYKNRVLIPEMLIKSRQGGGRVHRTEDDTGCIAVLDSRVAKDEFLRERFINAMPDMTVTSDIQDIPYYYRIVKSPDYYL